MPVVIYTVQVKTKEGWVPGSTFYGYDTLLGMVGGHFTGSLEVARAKKREELKFRAPGTVRILRYVMPNTPITE